MHALEHTAICQRQIHQLTDRGRDSSVVDSAR